MNYNLFLDDVRDPRCLGTVLHWEVARSFAEFVKIIEERGLPERISFDHDLAFEHYPLAEEHPTMKVPYDSYKEKTGYHCALWLIEYCQKKGCKLPKWGVHSMNPVGRINITQVLNRYENYS